MKTKSKQAFSGPEDFGFIWNTNKKKTSKNQFPVTEFLQDFRRKVEETVMGPGAAAGIGCTAGLGMALVGGVGYDGEAWNNPRLVFGLGMGCGIGFGFGYGRGLGYGRSFESILDSNNSTIKRL
ncbi:hypothetical protein M5689_007208 [Euphorbia peplus]|nr:hypothetical protein M5689_007208 [Euphorbia peplus]